MVKILFDSDFHSISEQKSILVESLLLTPAPHHPPKLSNLQNFGFFM